MITRIVTALTAAMFSSTAYCAPEQKVEPFMGFGYQIDARIFVRPNVIVLDSPIVRIQITAVVCKSSAHKHGLRVGDEIVAVDGKEIQGLPFNEYFKMTRDKPKARFTLWRSDKLVEVDLESSALGDDLSCGKPGGGTI